LESKGIMKCTILGCGGSLGVPQLGCSCLVCKSNKTHNKRTRASVLIESKTTKVLIDTSSDFREQAFAQHIDKIDAIIYTHPHSDHFSGINDFKAISIKMKTRTPVYLNKATFDGIKGSFGYLFESNSELYKPVFDARIIDDFSEIKVGDITLNTFRQFHGECNSLGIRVGNFVYSTDFNLLPDESIKALEGVETWVIDCLRYMWAPTHNYYETAMDWIERMQPKRAILTHMAHDLDYFELKHSLPQGIEPAYDGMVIKF
jgi:phosphoribosyl 1,2-cyclic phosphate phosphodiesterase